MSIGEFHLQSFFMQSTRSTWGTVISLEEPIDLRATFTQELKLDTFGEFDTWS